MSACLHEELKDLCFELGEKKEELAAYTQEKLENAGVINFFTTRGLLRNAVICELPEILDEVNKSFMETVRIAFANKKFLKPRERLLFLIAGYQNCLHF